jgi:hypothetical protein
MAVSLQREHDNVYRMDISGVLLERDFLALQGALAADIEATDGTNRTNRIRLLVVLTGFEGWEQGAGWRNLGFYIRHGNDIERIAIVGEDRWRAEALMFAAADLRDAPVAYFEAVQAAQARAWLSH